MHTFDSLNNIRNIDSIQVSKSYFCEPEDCKSFLVNPNIPTSLKILTQNIRSISANFLSLQTLLFRLNIPQDIIVLTECWLLRNPYCPILEGYLQHSTKTNRNQNDGVVVYIRNNLTNVKVFEPHFADASCIVIQVGFEICIIAIYRSPSNRDVSQFLSSLDYNLSLNKCFRTLVVMGDININIDESSSDPMATEYLNLLASHGLLPGHNYPTHNRTNLDHIILKTNKNAITIVLDSVVTDHRAVILSMDNMTSPPASKIKNTINYKQLSSAIKNIDFTSLYNATDADQAFNYFVNSLNREIKLHTITKLVPHRLRIFKPWITPGLLRCIRNRDRMHKSVKLAPNNEVLSKSYKRYRNFCNNLLKKLKNQYDTERLNKAGTNAKKLWHTIHEITNTKKKQSSADDLLAIGQSPSESLSVINNFFVNVGKELAQTIQSRATTKNKTSPVCYNNANSFVLLQTDETEVDSVINSLRSDCASGCDGITASFLKNQKSFLLRPLTHILNLCFSTGVFPDILKKAMICPIHKSGTKDQVNNYRPISILPSLSKVMEKIMNNRLKKFLEQNKLLSDSQYGFRNGKSTNDAVHDLGDHIVRALDGGKKCLAIFLDLAKAFDTVSIPRLVSKLEAIGVRGTQLKLFQSYLSNRTQMVKVGEHISTELKVEYGVPQGSILGPTLFLIYVNDMCNIKLQEGKLIAFADDTALIFTGADWKSAYQTAQTGFNRINTWLENNVLSLNIDKTKYLRFSITKTGTKFSDKYNLTAHNHQCNGAIGCSCLCLKRVDTIKYLGVTLDDRLSFRPHIDILSGRVRKLIYIFKQLRHVANPKIVKMVYFALCQSLLGYCILTWGGAAKSHLIILERAQRALLKVSYCKPYRYPTEDLYKLCEVLTVRQIFLQQIILRQHVNNDCFVTDTKSKRKCRKRNVVPRSVACKTAFSKRFFCYLGSSVYNTANNILFIEDNTKYECKKKVTNWLLGLNYANTENVLSPQM